MSELDADIQSDEPETSSISPVTVAEAQLEPPAEPAPDTETAAARAGDGARPRNRARAGAATGARSRAAAEPEAELPAEPEAAAEAAPAPGPRTVGRFIADALRDGRRPLCLHRAGRIVPRTARRVRGAGIRVIATRHEGPASFMAEAHGQLTGRPAVSASGRAPSAARTWRSGSTRRARTRPRCSSPSGRSSARSSDERRSRRSTRSRRSEAWPSGPPSRTRPRMSCRWCRRPSGRPWAGDPGPAFLSLPEDLLDEPMPDDARLETHSPDGGPSLPTTAIRAVIELLASARRPVILAGAGILRARTSTELTRFAELLQVPVIAAWRRPDVMSNDHPLYLGMAGLWAATTVRERLDAADALVVIGSRLNEATTYGYTVPRDGLRWAHVDLEPGHARGVPAAELDRGDRRQGVPARRERAAGRDEPSSTPTRSRPGRPTTRPTVRPGRPRASSTINRGTDRASIPVGRWRPSAASCPTTRS